MHFEQLSGKCERSITLCIAALAAFALAASAVPPPSGVAPVTSPAGGFAIDGQLCARTSGDWLPGTGGDSVLGLDGSPLNSSSTFHSLDPFSSTADLVFVGGLKWTDDPNTWQWTASKASSKTDINNVLMHVASDADGHTWLIIAADRASTSGDSYIDFEFLQNPLTRTNGSQFVSAGPHGGRTVNDVLLSLAFTSGGSVADFFAFRWQPAGSGYAYVDSTASLPAGRVFVAASTNNTAVPFGAFGTTTYAGNAFAEAAIDLTALLGSFDPCLSIGVKTVMVKTKSSQSSTATIGDFIDPIQYSMKLGPSANAGPDQVRCDEGGVTRFPLPGQATRGTEPIASTEWSVISGTVAIDSPTSLVTTARLASASAVLRLTVMQANGCTETDEVLLTVAPNPANSIAGPPLVCPRSSTQFTGPAGMGSYAWSVEGNAALLGATNARTVTVAAGPACGTNFMLRLNVGSNLCYTACSTEVQVNDTTPPILHSPTNMVLECPADTRTNVTGTATAEDDCAVASISYSDVVTNICGGARMIVRTWVATDLCGNTSTASQVITVRDTRPPVLNCPPNITLECPADLRTNVTGTATALDACGMVTVSYTDVISNVCGSAKVVLRTWRADDECGNWTTTLQIITVRDTRPPALFVPADITLECPAETGTNATGIATAVDACGQTIVTYSDIVSNGCGGTKIVSRLWTATDECGNATNRLQKIIVRDITPPSLIRPPNVVLECPADTSTNSTGSAFAQDGCGSVIVSYSDTVTNSCGGTKMIQRLWTAADACGNASNVVQVITVRDTRAPSLMCPPNLVLECPADTTTNATGSAFAQDACGPVTIQYTDTVTNGCGGSKTIARTWMAVDNCGNSTNAVQWIQVKDTRPPTLVCPPNLVLECPADTSTNTTGTAFAQDACGAVSVSYSDTVTNGCGGTKMIQRLWTAADACGNASNVVQVITVRDTRAPSLMCPPNLVLECPADTTTNATGAAFAQDACGSVTIQYTDTVTNGCGGSKTIARTWMAVDNCGNSTNAVQWIQVKDTRPPTIVCPPNLVLECPADTSTNTTGTAFAQDACGAVAVSYSDTVTNGCGGSKTISRLWTATDACGNRTNAVQLINVRDITPPSLIRPPNVVLECPADTSTNATGTAFAQDACGAVSVSYSDTVTNGCGGTKVIQRLWTAADACGNASNVVQVITVRDTRPPSLVCPPNLVLECPAETTTNVTGAAFAQDACGSVSIQYTDVMTNGCGGSKTIARTWMAVDTCGNSTNAVQWIQVKDTRPPTLVCPPNLVLECPADVGTNATGVALGQDACGSVAVSFVDTVTNGCGGSKTISRLWTATDACGNRTNAVQLLTVRDTTAPTLVCPPNLVLECPADLRTNVTGSATAQDGCGTVTVTYTDAATNGCGGTKTVARTWVAIDACGNRTNAVQIITVQDTVPPSLKLPANIVLECPGDLRTNVTGTAVALEGCGSATLTYSDFVTNGCGLTKTVLRLWTATDPCGNTTNGVQTITVVDTKPPTITCPAVKVQCTGDVPAPYATLAAFLAGGGTASDACGQALTFGLVSDSGLVGSCPGKVTRVYRVTDDCGNSADGTQVITVADTIAPVLTCLTNMTVECGLDALSTNRTGIPKATDNCDTNVIITYTDATIPSQYSLKWYAADQTPNSAPYLPTYLKLSPASLSCPDSARLTGRAIDPLRNAVAFGPNASQLDALTSMGAEPMCFGQIVPFEAVIEVSGGPGPEHGRIQFTSTWSTHTTSNDEFGYDKDYMVYAAFVDGGDPGLLDPHNNARVDSYTSTVVGAGTVNEKIQGTFQVSGLDSGDRVVVEIWVVLKATAPRNFGGTIASDLLSAEKLSSPPEPLSMGAQTVSIGSLSKLSALPAPQQQPPLGPLPPQPPVPPGMTVRVVDRTWAATDDCGNRSTCVQRITVRDTTAPVLAMPPDLVLQCPADVTTNSTGSATAQDGCGLALVTYSDMVTNGCGGTKVIARTWTALDESGNGTNRTQLITVRDSTAPALISPPDLTLEAPADTSTARTGIATAQDACGSATVTFVDSVQSGAGATKVVSRVWTAIDACGNATNRTQTITVRDTSAPVLKIPASLVLEVPADTGTNSTGTATAEDISGPVTISFADVVTNICGASRLIARTWTATDSCGLTSSAVQTILVRDTTPPKIRSAVGATRSVAEYRNGTVLDTAFTAVFAAGLRIGSGSGTNGSVPPNELYWEPSQSGLNALFACLTTEGAESGPLQRNETNPSDTAGGGELAREAIALSLNAEFNKTGLLGAGPNNFGGMQYASPGDALDGQTVGQILAKANSALAGLGLPAGYDYQSLARLLAELNSAFAQGAASDWAAAHLDSPMLLVQCASQVPGPAPSQVTVTDNSSIPVNVFALPDALVEYVNSNKFILQRTWVAEDPCGNTNTASFRIAVNDTLAPRLNINVRRTFAVGQPWTFDEPTAVDNCGSASVRVLTTVTNLTTTNLVATRTWEGSDLAGNTSTCQQTITVPLPTPLVAPTITAQPQWQTAEFGGTATLTVTAAGSGPFSYQWRLNGQNLAGATGSALVLPGVHYANAGVYSVVVSNAAGVASSPAALVNVAPHLRSIRAGNSLRMSWDSPFILQSAATVIGPYADVPGATSPYEPNLAGVQEVYYRLRSPEFGLTSRSLDGGQVLVEVTGVPGWNYVIQASSNLRDWVPLCTNTAPCSYVDSQAGLYSMRMYRVVPIETRTAVPATPPVLINQPQSRTAVYGSDLNLTVTAAGPGPLTYQWRRSGNPIPGATSSVLSLKNLQYTNAGVYSVVVGNSGGTVISTAALIDVVPRLLSQVTGKNLTLNWAGPFSLQLAPEPAGPYSTLANASSPYALNMGGAVQSYFRLIGKPFTIATRSIAAGQFAVDVTGAPGRNLVLQSSSDLKNWVNLQTNTAPWTWVDSGASSGSMRTFRVIPAQ